MQITMQEAQSRLPELLAQAAAGGEVVITDGDGKPLAQLVPSAPPTPTRRMGWLKGKMAELKPGDPFFDPLPEEELRLWNGEDS